jgi:multidrug resistance protein, MATE family
MNKHELKQILTIAIPSIISWVGHMGYGIVDNLMIGRILGSTALATSGIATSLYFMFLSFGIGSAGIIVSLMSEAFARQKDQLSKIMQNSLLFSFAIGVMIFITIFSFSALLISFLNNQKELSDNAILFLKTLAPAPIFAMIFITYERLSESLHKAKYATYTILFCNLCNIFFNYSFLTGSFGLPNLGLNGAAITTLSVNILEAVIIVIICHKNKLINYALQFKKNYFTIDLIKKLLKLGIPGGFFAVAEMSLFSIGSFFASQVSIQDVAAHQIISWVVGTILIPIFGFGVAVTVRIAYNKADEKPLLAFKIGLYSIIGSGIYMFIMLFIFWIFRNEIAILLLKDNVNDRTAINFIVATFSIILFGQIADGMQVMGNSVLRGFKDVKSPLIYAVFSYLIIAIPMSYYLGIIKNMGVVGVWIGIGIGVTFQTIFILIRLIKKFKPIII